MNQEEDLLSAVRELVDAHFSDLRRTVRKNLARLTCAFLHLAWSIRFGYGGLHLTSIARVLPQGKKFKSSYKWLSRFLKCKYFDASSLAECMLAVILGQTGRDRKSTRLNSSHLGISYAVFCLKK